MNSESDAPTGTQKHHVAESLTFTTLYNQMQKIIQSFKGAMNSRYLYYPDTKKCCFVLFFDSVKISHYYPFSWNFYFYFHDRIVE